MTPKLTGYIKVLRDSRTRRFTSIVLEHERPNSVHLDQPRISHVPAKRPEPGPRLTDASPSSRFESKRADTREDTGANQSERAGVVAELRATHRTH